MKLKYQIRASDNYNNLKELLKNHFEISDRLLVKLKHNQKLYINGEVANINSSLELNDVVRIFAPIQNYYKKKNHEMYVKNLREENRKKREEKKNDWWFSVKSW